MPKETFYFSHDYEPTGDPKMQALIGEYGAAGYGIFWRITEMLHSNSEHKLPLKPYFFLAIAKQLLTSAEQVQKIISYCIEVCELFIENDGFFYSNRVVRNLEKRAEISEKRSEAGKLGAIAKQNLANAKQNLANTSKGKERKEKEINLKERKGKESELISTNGKELQPYELHNAPHLDDPLKPSPSFPSFLLFPQNNLETVKKLFVEHTKIKNPSDFYLKSVAKFYETIPEGLNFEIVSSVITSLFASLKPDQPIRLDYLCSNIQRQITLEHESFMLSRKKEFAEDSSHFFENLPTVPMLPASPEASISFTTKPHSASGTNHTQLHSQPAAVYKEIRSHTRVAGPSPPTAEREVIFKTWDNKEKLSLYWKFYLSHKDILSDKDRFLCDKYLKAGLALSVAVILDPLIAIDER